MTSFIVLSCESLELTAGDGVQEAQHQTLPAGHPSHQQKFKKNYYKTLTVKFRLTNKKHCL